LADFFEEMAVVADELIAEFGGPADLEIRGAVTGSAWEQTATVTLEPVTVADIGWTTRQRESPRILSKDRHFLLAALSAGTPPSTDKRLWVDGVAYKIVDMDTIKRPGGAEVIFDLHCRA
jgi:hypothetical protein